MFRKLLSVLLLSLPAVGIAQKHAVTIDEIYDPAKRVAFAGSSQRNLRWIDDERILWAKTSSTRRVTDVVEINAVNGKSKPFFDARKFEALLQKETGVSEADAQKVTHQSSYEIARRGTRLLVAVSGDLFTYDIPSNRLTRLTSTPEEELEFAFSPDGRSVSFVRGNNLYVIDASGDERERRITSDGNGDVQNGILDWLYQEEIFGRGDFRAYWWSPDSKSIAFLRLDETNVPRHTIVDDIPYEQEVTAQRYPKAGEPNPVPKILVADVDGGEPRDLTLPNYTAADLLLVNVAWTPDSTRVVYQAANREQTWLDLVMANRASREAKTILRETSPAWVEVIGSPRFLVDGTFLWLSGRSGWRHLYHMRADGSVIRQVTTGDWEVRDLEAFDPKNGWIYFTANEREAVGQDLYRVRLDGSGFERVSERRGTHSPLFNDAATRFTDSWSDVSTPPQLRLHSSDGREIALLDANPSKELAHLILSKPEFLQVKARDGYPMEALMIRPADFDPAKKYPVFQYLYAGPTAPTVDDSWDGSTYLFHQALAQRGIIVWICDNRSASGKGLAPAWTNYKHFGDQELRDIEDGVAWLAQQPWIDASRVMLYGWSFGGFMTSYALTHSTSFAAGIAGAPVTDWRDYDSVYTERYLLTPQHNPEGYRSSSPRFAAENLHGNLLLISGTVDDNVHLQNTVQFMYELQKAGKNFRTMLYAKSQHGVTVPQLTVHMRRMMFDFVMESLKP